MKTNFALIVLFLIGTFNNFAQVQRRDITKRTNNNYFYCNVQNGLFYDLENPISFSTHSKSTIQFSASDNVVIHKINNYSFTAKPKNKGEIWLYALDSISKDTLLKKSFSIRNIPMPDLFLGNITDSMSIQLLPNALVSWQFKEFVPTECLGRISQGKVRFQHYEFPFYGDRIPEEIVVELYKLKRVSQISQLPIQLEVTVSCPSCIARKLTRTYFLI